MPRPSCFRAVQARDGLTGKYPPQFAPKAATLLDTRGRISGKFVSRQQLAAFEGEAQRSCCSCPPQGTCLRVLTCWSRGAAPEPVFLITKSSAFVVRLFSSGNLRSTLSGVPFP